MGKHVKKDYRKGDLVVNWDSARCEHSAICLKGLPGVFNLRQRPWINLDGADADAVRETVRKCPSGALSLPEASAEEARASGPEVAVQVIENGPLRLRGDFEITNDAGEVLPTHGVASLCRCGRSRNKPFCDGTHHKPVVKASGG